MSIVRVRRLLGSLFIVTIALTAHADVIAQVKIVTFGDSITAPRKGVVTYSDVLENEFRQRNIQATVINAGVPGNTTSDAAGRFEKDVIARGPNIVAILFGANDSAVDVWKTPPAIRSRVAFSEYKRNLRGFIGALKSRGVRVILMTYTPTTWTEKLRQLYGKPPYDPNDPDGFNSFLKNYVAAVRRIAAEEKVNLVDNFSAFRAYGRVPGQKLDDLLLDGLHPNSLGHKVIADLLLERLIRVMKIQPTNSVHQTNVSGGKRR